MKLTDLEPFIKALKENKPFAILENGELKEINADLNPKDVREYTTPETIKQLILKRLFDSDSKTVGVKDYTFFVEIAKIVNENTAAVTKNRLPEKIKIEKKN